MIALKYTPAGKVLRRFEGPVRRVIGKDGLLVLAHLRKLKPAQRTNVVDVANVDVAALTCPLHMLTVTQDPLGLVYDPAAPTPVVPPSDLDVAIEAFRGVDSPRARALIAAYDAI